jgi:exodeoxyribonuclease V alpha subunit
VRSGRADDVLDVLARGGDAVEHVDLDAAAADEQLDGVRADTVAAGEELVRAARSGDAEASLERLDRHRVLCAHREGAYGVRRWSLLMEEWLRDAVDGYAREGRWYVGRPLMVTSNDYQLRLFNGDTGVVVQDGSGVRAAFRRDNVVDRLPVSRLSEVQTVHAMSVHRSQGSQFARVTLVLPPADSPLLTRELLYTAITRAKEHVRIVGTAAALAAAVERPIARASGLRERG